MEIIDVKGKRKRASNFSFKEEHLLLSLVKKYSNLIECKKTDAVSNKEKEYGWDKLHKEFNSQSGEHMRTCENLKAKYDNLKRIAKKQRMDEKKERFKTGGGTPNIPKSDVNSELIRELMGVGLEGMFNPYDNNGTYGVKQTSGMGLHIEASSSADDSISVDTAVDVSTVEVDSSITSCEVVQMLEMDTRGGNEYLTREEILSDFPKDWSVWSPTALKRRKSKELIAPSLRSGTSISTSIPDTAVLMPPVAATTSVTENAVIDITGTGNDKNDLKNQATPQIKNSGINKTPVTRPMKNPRSATASKLHEMAGTRIHLAKVKEELLRAEYNDHKAREDKLLQWKLKSLKLTVAIKRQKLLNLRRARRTSNKNNIRLD